MNKKIKTSSYISSSPVFADTALGPILVWAGDALHVTDLDGKALPGWPQYGKKYFASSPALGDIDGDGQPEIVCGNDDHCLYAFRLNGSTVLGFPFETGGDVYSTAALCDLNGDGKLEIVFGSDDGCVYVLDFSGKSLPGWPKKTGHFVSASPCVADIDGDGRLEIVIGSWDQNLYVWRMDGTLLPGWPIDLGATIWSSATAADLDGDGQMEIVVAADQLYVLRCDGSMQPGFPVRTGSWMHSSPCVADGDGIPEIAVGAEKFYVFRSNGELAPGFPADLGGHIWASPLCADVDGDGDPEWLVGSWQGSLQTFKRDGRCLGVLAWHTQAAIYGSAAVYWHAGHLYLACGSWDTCMYLERVSMPKCPEMPEACFRSNALRNGNVLLKRHQDPGKIINVQCHPNQPIAGQMTYVDISVPDPVEVRQGMLIYCVNGREHPSPMVLHQGKLRGMIHPLGAGVFCSWRAELKFWNGAVACVPDRQINTFGFYVSTHSGLTAFQATQTRDAHPILLGHTG